MCWGPVRHTWPTRVDVIATCKVMSFLVKYTRARLGGYVFNVGWYSMSFSAEALPYKVLAYLVRILN